MSEEKRAFVPGQQFRFMGPNHSSILVILLVGEAKTAFVVHEDILTSSSSFFASAVKKEWQKNDPKTIELPDDDADVVGIYIEWLYSNRTIIRHRDGPRAASDGSDDRLIRAHIFGDKICDTGFANKATDELIDSNVTKDGDGKCVFPNPETISIAYGRTSKSSPMRKLLVHYYASYSMPGWYASDTHQEFLLDLVNYLIANRSEGRRPFTWWPEHKGDYHLKAAGEVELAE